MIDLFNNLLIAIPVFYLLTVGGLIAGFRRAEVPFERGIPRALRIGPPVLFGTFILWHIIIAVFEARGAPHQFDGLDLLLGFVFTLARARWLVLPWHATTHEPGRKGDRRHRCQRPGACHTSARRPHTGGTAGGAHR